MDTNLLMVDTKIPTYLGYKMDTRGYKNPLHPGHDWLYFLDDVADHFYQREPTPGLDVNPNRWIKEFEGINEMEWYHPNPT